MVTDIKQARSIILIDDDEVTNFVNEELMQELNAAQLVISFEKAQTALDYLSSYKFQETRDPDAGKDIIFLDLNMPEMDGFDFLAEMRSLFVPATMVLVVMLGTKLQEAGLEKMESYRTMVSEYVEKPLTRAAIYKILNNYI